VVLAFRHHSTGNSTLNTTAQPTQHTHTPHMYTAPHISVGGHWCGAGRTGPHGHCHSVAFPPVSNGPSVLQVGFVDNTPTPRFMRTRVRTRTAASAATTRNILQSTYRLSPPPDPIYILALRLWTTLPRRVTGSTRCITLLFADVGCAAGWRTLRGSTTDAHTLQRV